MLKVQRYVEEITVIVTKTEAYGKEVNLIGKYLKNNIKNNLKNYLDMIVDRKEIEPEELVLIIREFEEFMGMDILEEYFPEYYSRNYNLK